MKLLLDTHLLLWAAGVPDKLSEAARGLLNEPENLLIFSVASIWEVAIKQSLKRSDFRADARLLRRGLLDNGYEELPITGAHAVALDILPPLHKDPFDRILLAQAQVEGILLLTSDDQVAQYPGAVRRV
ncbi:MAG: type II toxin-antitoxin system VapC family toxin [Alphaproteobacteria bacterium]|nr:type II toxin-antitoxin system VapC family toxin [Alphaproteobacteria bacterium]